MDPRGKVSDAEWKRTRKVFEQLVGNYMAEHDVQNADVVAAVYAVHDELTARAIEEQGVTIACRQGCSVCCNQLVCVVEPEWKLILDYLHEHTKKKLWRQLLAQSDAWMEYYRAQGEPQIHTTLSSITRVYAEWRGKPCAFLRGGNCAIYPVRPIDCRTMLSTIRCKGLGKEPGVERMMFLHQHHANNLIYELSIKPGQPRAVVPIPHRLSLLFAEGQ